MNYTFKENIDEGLFDEFVYNHQYGTFFQSSNWTKVKSSWKHHYTGVYEADQLVSVCLILERKLPLNISLMYAPRGPVLDFENKELLSFTLESLKQFAKKYKTMALTIDPFIKRAEYSMHGAIKKDIEITYDDHLLVPFIEHNYIHTGFVLDLRDSFQPRFTPIIRFDDNKSYTKSKGYKEGLKALNRDVKVTRGKVELVDRFYELTKHTEAHQNISLRNATYYQSIMENYQDDSMITISSLNFKEQLENTRVRIVDLNKRLDNQTISVQRRNEYTSQLNKLLKTENEIIEELKVHNKIDIAGLLIVKNGKRSEFLYAGMNRHYQSYNGSAVNYVDGINWSDEHKLEAVSFGGNSGYLDEGIDKFKANFDANILEYIGEFTLVNRSILFYLFNKAVAIRRK